MGVNDSEMQERNAEGRTGNGMTLADLPPPETKRWVARRKAQVVAGVRAGVLTIEEACRRYRLTVEEFQSWEKMINRHGVRGLRVTRIQQYRDSRPGEDSAYLGKAVPSPGH